MSVQTVSEIRSSHDTRIVRAIRYICRNFERQPSLAEIADHVNLSPYHFNRLFRRGTGVTPKQFMRSLTVESAKEALAQDTSVLNVAINVGLSGPGRLHDLFVTLEAVTPGEFKSGGEGMTLRYGVAGSPFGQCLIALSERGVCHLSFLPDAGEPSAIDELHASWPRATLIEDRRATAEVAATLFELDEVSEAPRFRVLAKGTNFQIQVWRALLSIPAGETCSYSDVARSIGRPSAVRAVANAVARNPISVMIPCHRVLRSTGALGGYRWGTARKRALLEWEQGLAKA